MSQLPQLVAAAGLFALLAHHPSDAATPAPPPGSFARQLEADFVAAFEKVAPSVVVIESEKDEDARDVVWRMFFDAPQDENLPDQDAPKKKEQGEKNALPAPKHRAHPRPDPDSNQGSGTIIRADGYIVTNHHVVDGARKIWVYLRDGTKHEARLIGTEPSADLAVVKIEAKNLQPAKLGNSESIRVGQWTIAVGAPFNLEYSYSVGWLSGKKRGESMRNQFLPEHYVQYLQTTAPINPGNSGGPLCNIDGDVIGLNTLIRGLGTSVGFAIPADLIDNITRQLIENGSVVRPWLGIRIRSLRYSPEAVSFYPGMYQGVVVEMIPPDGPAAKSALQPLDLITAVDGAPVHSASDLVYEIVRKKPDKSVALSVLRGQPGGKPEELVVNVTLQAMPHASGEPPAVAANAKPEKAAEEKDPLGIRVEAVTPELREQFSLGAATSGVVVTEVDEEGLGANFELAPGTLITAIDRRAVPNPAEYRSLIKTANLDKGALLFLVKDGNRTYTIIRKEAEENP